MKPHSFFPQFSRRSLLPLAAFALLLQIFSCSKSSPQSGVNYTGSASLSLAGVHAAAAAGNKILFAGGYDFTADTFSRTVDIYDVSTGSWSTTQLSQGRGGMAGAGTGTKILFAGGLINNVVSKIVDIYDVSSNSWTTAQLSEPRNSVVAAAAGNKILFAGGLEANYTISKTVDIYDVSADTWTTAQLSEARYLLASGAAGNKILFGGGTGENQATATVDIYDVSSNTWSTAKLSEARFALAGAGAGDKVLFAGGLGNHGVSDIVDIYTVSSNSWTTAHLSEARENLAGAGTGNRIFFGGGNTVIWPASGSGNINDSGAVKTVDIFDVASSNQYTDQLSQAREGLVAAGSGNKILFAGGSILDSALDPNLRIMTSFYTFPKTIDIFTLR